MRALIAVAMLALMAGCGGGVEPPAAGFEKNREEIVKGQP